MNERTEVIVVAVPLAANDVVARIAELNDPGRQLHRTRRHDGRHLRFSGWVLDLIERRLVAPGGGVVSLPGIEFALLRAFVESPRRVLSRSRLAELTQRDGRTFRSARTVDVYVSRLRRRLSRAGGGPLISTVWRAGYVFEADVV